MEKCVCNSNQMGNAVKESEKQNEEPHQKKLNINEKKFAEVDKQRKNKDLNNENCNFPGKNDISAFSPNRPTRPIWSSSRDVQASVC